MKSREQLTLQELVLKNELIMDMLMQVQKLKLPFPYLLGGGFVFQSLWNQLSGRPLVYGLSDVDIIYYNKDLTQFTEKEIDVYIKENISSPFPLDINNVAVLHEYYDKQWGKEIKPFLSILSPSLGYYATVQAILLKLENNELKMFTPFGTDDLFKFIIRKNKYSLASSEYFKKKSTQWKGKWEEVIIIE